MARMILAFCSVWLLVALGIEVFRAMSRREKWQLVKTLTVSGGYAIIAFVLLMALVILF